VAGDEVAGDDEGAGEAVDGAEAAEVEVADDEDDDAGVDDEQPAIASAAVTAITAGITHVGTRIL